MQNTTLEKTDSLDSLKTHTIELLQKLVPQQKQAVVEACKTVDILLDFGANLAVLKSRMSKEEFDLWASASGIESGFAARAIKAATTYGRADYRIDMQAARQLWLLADLTPVVVHGSLEEARVTLPPVIQRLNWLAEWVTRDSDDVGTWEPQRRADLKDRLRPVVEFYSKL